MKCPKSEDGVHHIGAHSMCSCGYVLRIPPISVSFHVFNLREELVNDCFNCDTIDGAIEGFEQAIATLEKLR